MSANQQNGEEIFFLFLCSFTFHAKNLLWLDCHSRFFYKLEHLQNMQMLQPVEKGHRKVAFFLIEEENAV